MGPWREEPLDEDTEEKEQEKVHATQLLYCSHYTKSRCTCTFLCLALAPAFSPVSLSSQDLWQGVHSPLFWCRRGRGMSGSRVTVTSRCSCLSN